MHVAGDAQLVREVTHTGELLVAVGSTGSADDEQDRRRVAELGEATHREPDALQRLDASREQQRALVPEPEPLLGEMDVVGKEHGVVDAGRYDLDALGDRAVVQGELLTL